MSKIVITVLIFVWIQSYVSGYKILAILSHPGKSHFFSFAPLIKNLIQKGHELTVISYFPLEGDFLYHKIILGNGSENGTDKVQAGSVRCGSYRRFLVPYLMQDNAYASCETGFTNAAIKQLYECGDYSFDLAIVELFSSRCYLGIVYKLQCPFIGISSTTIFTWFHTPINSPDNPAFVPNTFSRFMANMTFLQRAENLCLNLLHEMQFRLFLDLYDRQIIRKYLGKEIPSMDSIAANMSLLFVNSHFSISSPRPQLLNVIDIAGMHIGKIQPLLSHIEKWINESTHGIIYFSMGSMIKGHTFPEEKRQMFLRAFARLPQRVLWKWETETMPGKPDNVMLLKWMPQFDILCHPNVKAFIAHGGLLGVTESVHCGVPMLLMPQFGDQFTNSKAIEANGGGIMLDFRYITEEQIFESLTTILSDSFNKKAKELSARFKDRPMPPLETAIYWVEYVARHKGAPHLRTAAVGMPLYKYLLLDVIAFLLTILFVLSYIGYKIIRAVFRLIFSSKSKIKTN